MDLSKLLDESHIEINGGRLDKEAVLRTIAGLATQSSSLAGYSAEDVFRALADREKLSSTGFGRGIAIPHCALKEASDFVVGILLVPGGAEFDAADGEDTKLFVFIVGPESRRNDHIRLLSTVSRVLHEETAVGEILSCTTPAGVREAFCRHSTMGGGGSATEEYSLVHVFVQDELLFEQVLPVVAQIDDSSVSIVEGANAHSILGRIPLYASFWRAETKGFHRIIIAVVKRRFANEAVRQISTVASRLGSESGYLVCVQDLDHASGRLDL